MEKIRIQDLLHLAQDNEILKEIKTETLYFSDMITKINHYGISQERVIILTDEALYNFKKKSLRRRIPYQDILGVTFSEFTYEFVVHGNDDEYDYEYLSHNRCLIICLIAKLYEAIRKIPLKICEAHEKSLKAYVTSKKEKKKDNSFSKMDEKLKINTSQFLEKYQKEYSGNDFAQINNNDDEIRQNSTLFSRHDTIKNVCLEDFQVIKVIGRGSFGKVCLVQYKSTKEFYAMKSLKKDVLLDHEQVESTLLEKKILEHLDHPFLLGMVFCFQTIERIYFVMPFIRGGELFQHLKTVKCFPEDKVRFYAAIIGLALDYLHKNDIIYRDIKPENILIEEDGYLKLIDFGMAKTLKDDEKATSFCGTPEYLAPEVITGEGHNKSADWWSYGILIYEMIFGIPPFYCDNTEKMYDLIAYGELKFPKKFGVSDGVKDLIRKLLNKNQEERLGSNSGFSEIKEHQFFKGFDFKSLLEKKIKPPFKPTLKGESDVTNFDSEFTSEDIACSAIPEKNLEFIKRNQDQFKDFNS